MTTVGKIAVFLTAILLCSSVNAQQVIGFGPVSGAVYVMRQVRTVPVPVPVPVPTPAPTPVPVVPTYNYVPTPEASNIYSPPGYPTNVPVATTRNGCAMYVDPYDLFGQLFGGADLVQSCWRPAY